MKTRKGFVSNSSTTSFVCDVCSHVASGSDCLGIKDYGFDECPNGHTICSEHVIKANPKQRLELTRKITNNPVFKEFYEECYGDFETGIDLENDNVDDLNDLYNEYILYEEGFTITVGECPICQFKSASIDDYFTFNLFHIPEFLKGIKKNYGNYKAFNEHLKDIKEAIKK